MEKIVGGIASTAKSKYENMTGSNAKTADLERDTVDNMQKGIHATTDHGVAIPDHDNWLSVTSENRHGPALLEDQIGREKVHRFDHERIPERVVHARGAGAFGHFRLLESAADVTKAKVLTDTSRTTPVFVRFSTVLGSRGSADTVRDVRGFAIKMYTEEGNWDIVGNDIPVFFIQDGFKFTDLIHAGKPEPDNEVPQAQTAHNNFWDFVFLHSEATHMFGWTMSDRGIPRSYRMMQGFGVNTFCLINEKGVRSFVKFHWTPELGVHSLVWDEALKLAGQDPDFHRKDLHEAIENGAYPKWKFGIQVLEESRQDDFDFDILDATKLWPEELIPIRYIGELELNRVVDEYFTQTEQVAFCTSHLVPGIDFSDDPLLATRNLSYFDTQLSRLGINWQELPINRPVCPVMNFNRDGQGRHKITKGKINYYPNRHDAVPALPEEDGGFTTYHEKVAGIKARLKSRKFKEHISQAQLFYNSLAPHEKLHYQQALSFELDHCDDPIVYNRMAERLAQIDVEMAQKVSSLIATEDKPSTTAYTNHGRKSAALSQAYYDPKTPTIATRRIALLIADGYDSAVYTSVKAAITGAGGVPWTIAPRRREIFPEGASGKAGSGVVADHHLEGQRSTMFDALFLVPGKKSVETLAASGRARQWVTEAFGHLKAIAAPGEAAQLIQQTVGHVALLKDAAEEAAKGSSESVLNSYGVITSVKHDFSGLSEAVSIVKDSTNFLGQFFYAVSQHRNWDRELDGLISQVAY
jgi:catalase